MASSTCNVWSLVVARLVAANWSEVSRRRCLAAISPAQVRRAIVSSQFAHRTLTPELPELAYHPQVGLLRQVVGRLRIHEVGAEPSHVALGGGDERC